MFGPNYDWSKHVASGFRLQLSLIFITLTRKITNNWITIQVCLNDLMGSVMSHTCEIAQVRIWVSLKLRLSIPEFVSQLCQAHTTCSWLSSVCTSVGHGWTNAHIIPLTHRWASVAIPWATCQAGIRTAVVTMATMGSCTTREAWAQCLGWHAQTETGWVVGQTMVLTAALD